MSTPLPIRVDSRASIPLATQLSQQLSWLIASGALGEGDVLPPVQEIADQLAINFHTVRSAYKRLEAEGLISVSRGRRARVLRFDRTRARAGGGNSPSFSIGVVIPSFVPFYGEMLAGIEAAASVESTMVVVANAHEDPETALEYLDRFVAKGVDGIIIAAALIPVDAQLPSPGRPPIVFVDSPGAPGASVNFDLGTAQRLATGHLLGHGHTRIGYITPPPHIPNVSEKLDAHLEAIAEAGLERDEDLIGITADFTMEEGRQAAEHFLDMQQPPTAIAAAADSLALGAYHTITSKGLDIPNDIALVGADGSELGAIIRPALTTVSLPVREAGHRAFTTLAEIGESGESPSTLLGVELTVRDSCGHHS